VCGADYDVTVPRDVTLKLSTVGGDVSVAGEPAALEASTVAGDIRARGCLVSADLHTVAGDIDVQSTCRPAALFTDTNVGDLSLRLPAGPYALTTSTHFGDVHVSGVRREPASKRIVRVVTSTGDIDIGAL
jgi:DUF4097 and DUF4098 domain-containing protein YvlB